MDKRPIPFIPFEIISLILVRVPARSLVRFRYVCKAWCNLIDSLWFARNQVSIASLQPQIVLVPVVPPPTSYRSFTFNVNVLEESSRSPILLFSYLHDQEYCLHVGGVGFGLVCFQSCDRLGEAYLCNPLTRQVLVLPRVTVIDSDALRNRFVAEVYTFGTKSLWRRISSSILRHIFHTNGIYAHGDMHWTNHLPYTSFFQCDPITSFNFEKEEFKLPPLPDFGYKPAAAEKFLLTTLRGSLAVVHVIPEETHFEIWLMKDYENKVWVREYKISMSNFSPKRDLKHVGFSRIFVDVREHKYHILLLNLINILDEKRLYAISNHTESVISLKHFDDDFREFVDQVPEGCHITIVSDSCHNGGLIDEAKEQIGESTKRQEQESSSGFGFKSFLKQSVQGAFESRGIQVPSGLLHRHQRQDDDDDEEREVESDFGE
ncbi:hypothetical protein Dsin_012051 [Dipteronia sinensis]|uniref:F-box domain-containing protein n=1 Tax=Dipteronia sinensis TaxID=43782 RepID=A0AAE0AHC7_9ROSI|nr:hypothetical protein Dsin_012051 [Dipteronia sinensis]